MTVPTRKWKGGGEVLKCTGRYGHLPGKYKAKARSSVKTGQGIFVVFWEAKSVQSQPAIKLKMNLIQEF
jgi:hypothetical protein